MPAFAVQAAEVGRRCRTANSRAAGAAVARQTGRRRLKKQQAESRTAKARRARTDGEPAHSRNGSMRPQRAVNGRNRVGRPPTATIEAQPQRLPTAACSGERSLCGPERAVAACRTHTQTCSAPAHSRQQPPTEQRVPPPESVLRIALAGQRLPTLRACDSGGEVLALVGKAPL